MVPRFWPFFVCGSDFTGDSHDARQHLFNLFGTRRSGQGGGLTLIRIVLVNHGFGFNLQTMEAGHTEFWIDFGRKQ